VLPSSLTRAITACLLGLALQAQAAGPVAGNPQAGRLKAEDGRCFECHGERGEGGAPVAGAEPKFAKLGGQHADYLVKQLQDFRSGARQNDFMRLLVRELDDGDLRDIAAYFASQPAPRGALQADSAPGARLYREGDAARGVVACASCHGESGRTAAAEGGPSVPILRGQDPRYLEEQLGHWRSGFRRNSPGNVMNQAIRPLTDDEIHALAAYLASPNAP
jgi:cytochrome c553